MDDQFFHPMLFISLIVVRPNCVKNRSDLDELRTRTNHISNSHILILSGAQASSCLGLGFLEAPPLGRGLSQE
jgi:hypothetical protein